MNWIQNFLRIKPKIVVVLGPTATGKTSLSIAIAKKYNGEVISADSRQVYRGLNIGSAKATVKEMDGIPHHMIDIADPKQIFSVQQYTTQGTKSINNILSRKKTVIICGGTGMYIDSLISGTQFPTVPPNPKLRSKIERKSTTELYSLLKLRDPRRAKTIDPDNPVRLVRALEVIDAIGVVPKTKKTSHYNVLYLGIDISKEELNSRIKKRVVDRFEKQNMLQEAIDLETDGLSYERMESLGLEYRFMARHLRGQITYTEMIDQLTVATSQFAKRQRTWFKRNKKIYWFKPKNDQKEIFELVSKFIY
ncbi:MAG: tRNA dimethylallyltransferase [Crocinitomicaceae bacterium]|jgi:tRNA dimethylallyltransferase